MCIATMINRFTGETSITVRAIEALDTSKRETFAFIVTFSAGVYQSPTGEQIDVPELSSVVSGNACELRIEMSARYIQALTERELDVLHVKEMMLSFAVGEMQHAHHEQDSYGGIDCEHLLDVTYLHTHQRINAALIDETIRQMEKAAS